MSNTSANKNTTCPGYPPPSPHQTNTWNKTLSHERMPQHVNTLRKRERKSRKMSLFESRGNSRGRVRHFPLKIFLRAKLQGDMRRFSERGSIFFQLPPLVLPLQSPALILRHTGLKKILLLPQIYNLTHPRKRILSTVNLT